MQYRAECERFAQYRAALAGADASEPCTLAGKKCSGWLFYPQWQRHVLEPRPLAALSLASLFARGRLPVLSHADRAWRARALRSQRDSTLGDANDVYADANAR